MSHHFIKLLNSFNITILNKLIENFNYQFLKNKKKSFYTPPIKQIYKIQFYLILNHILIIFFKI